jgi:hypothetical protein
MSIHATIVVCFANLRVQALLEAAMKPVRALLGARGPLLFWGEGAGVLYEQT